MPSVCSGERSAVPPGKAGGRDAGERVEAVQTPPERLGHQLSRQGREHGAQPRIAVGEQHAAVPPQVRQAGAGDGDQPAPGVVDLQVRGLGEDAAHVARHKIRHVGRGRGAISLAAAEQEAMVGGHAEVVHHEAAVGDGAVVGDQGVRALQGLCRDDVVAYRHDVAGDVGVQFAQEGVAGEDHVLGGHHAVRGVDAKPGPPLQPGRDGALVQHGARSGRRLRQAQRVVQRMVVAAEAVDQAAVVVRRGDLRLDVRRFHEAGVGVGHALGQAFGLAAEVLHVARLGGGGEVAGEPEVAGDRVAGGEVHYQFARLDGEVEEGAGLVGAVLRDQFQRAQAQARDDLATVAPRGAPADPPAFQEHHRQSRLRRVEGRRQPRAAAAHDADVGARLALQRRRVHARVRRCGVVGGGHVQAGVEPRFARRHHLSRFLFIVILGASRRDEPGGPGPRTRPALLGLRVAPAERPRMTRP